MEAFYTNLESILNITQIQAKQLVSQFSSGDLDFFQTYFNVLPTAKFTTNNVSGNTTLNTDDENIGAGAFGIIKKNRTRSLVYKSLVNRYSSDKRLKYLKPIFQEIIVQTLLQSDANYGKYVCILNKVYRVGNDCVFQMEQLETTLGSYIQSNEEAYMANPEPINNVLLKTLLEVLEILNYFNATYGFSHNDLSLDNIMIKKDGSNPKLIDFGLSSINFGNIQIGKQLKSRIDPSYLLTKLALYLDINPSKFSKSLEILAMLPPETPIQTYIDNLQPTKKSPKKRRKTRKN